MGSTDERFRQLFEDHFPAILRFALRRCHDSGDAADVAAETFLTAWRKLDQLPVGEERPWLFGVAQRAVSNNRRGHLRRSRLADRLRRADNDHCNSGAQQLPTGGRRCTGDGEPRGPGSGGTEADGLGRP